MINPDCTRGNEFLIRFTQLYEGMRQLGLSREQALLACASQNFVSDFVDTPEWFVSAKRLPKGYRWKDGKTFSYKGKRGETERYTFVECDNDLYIKDFFRNYATIKSTKKDSHVEVLICTPKEWSNKICVIKNWKSLKPHDAILQLSDGTTSFFQDKLLDMYQEAGVYCGSAPEITTKWNDSAGENNAKRDI